MSRAAPAQPGEQAARRPFRRVSAMRDRVRALPGGFLLWRVLVTVIGVAIIAIGIVLLPLPGPGWLIIFGGLGLLATEYTWARRLLGWLRDVLARWRVWVAARSPVVKVLLGLVSLAFLAALVLGGWLLFAPF